MATTGCEGFTFVNNVCKLLRTEYLYKDGTPQIEVYVPTTIPQPGNYKISLCLSWNTTMVYDFVSIVYS